MALLQKSLSAYRLLAVRLVIVVHSPVNNWTLSSVTYSLQDGCLASICTSYNEDSERNLWGLTAGCCRNRDLWGLTARFCKNGVFVFHVSWVWEARVADRFDPPTQHSPHLPSLVMLKQEGVIWCAMCTQATPPLLLSTKLTSSHPKQTVPGHVRSLATLLPSCIRVTTP